MATRAHDPLRIPAQFWQRDDVALTLSQRDIGGLFKLLRQYCGASQTRIGAAVGMTQSTVSLIMNGDQTVTAMAVLERIADGFAMPDDSRMQLGLAPKENPMKRRTALGLGLIGALSPAALTAVLRESAAEAMDFTASTASSVGTGTLDHLEAVVIELDSAARRRPASEVFPIARAYRQRIEQFLGGKRTIKEARELYLRAANLSELLSTLAHDLGSRRAAEAYAIDSYQHAELAGHDEACAWASGCLEASWWVLAGQADKAIAAAERGLSTAPDHSPIAAHLHAKAARGYALHGNRAACGDHLAKAKDLCQRLPDGSPQPVAQERRARTPYMVAKYAAEAHNSLKNYQAAEQEARDALGIETWSPGDADIVRIELGIARAGQGAPDEAVEHGKLALGQPRFLGSVLSRGRQLDTMLMTRYRKTPSTQEFHERYQQLAGHALAS
jgi:transcriptional regulator with XRE-family HTH domain